ncbi:hypothetical protein PRIPAC_74337 [Pristionchus pacificus]|nr:hypothetical protein PRIPAC_74337 [Pristionchus pacificus]
MAEQGNEAKEQELDCSLEPEHSRMELPKPCSLLMSVTAPSCPTESAACPRNCKKSGFTSVSPGSSTRLSTISALVLTRSVLPPDPWQMFNIGLRVLSRPDPNHLTKIYRTVVIERALDFNLIVDDFSLTELTFSPQYSVAVEAKQVAAQEAPRASFVVERAKGKHQNGGDWDLRTQ